MLTSKVKVALIDDPITKSGEIARSVDGVKGVRNDLEIRQKQRRSDRWRTDGQRRITQDSVHHEPRHRDR